MSIASLASRIANHHWRKRDALLACLIFLLGIWGASWLSVKRHEDAIKDDPYCNYAIAGGRYCGLSSNYP